MRVPKPQVLQALRTLQVLQALRTFPCRSDLLRRLTCQNLTNRNLINPPRA